MSGFKKYIAITIASVSIILAAGCSSDQVAVQDQTGAQTGTDQTTQQTQPYQQQQVAPQPQTSYQSVTAEQAKQLIDSDKTLQIIDVREEDEYKTGHIAGTKLIPMSRFMSRYGEIDKAKPVLVYCAVGARSEQAAQVLAQSGYKVYAIVDGLDSWTYGLEQ